MRFQVSATRPGLIGVQDEMHFDAHGQVVAQKHPVDQNVGTRILGALGQLHFGWYGGIALRIIYGLLGLALCVVTVSGVNVWLARRRDKSRPAPALERLWAGLVWGQPVTLAAVALATRLAARTPEPALAWGWVIGTVLLAIGAACAGRASRQTIALGCRAVIGGLLLLIAVTGLTAGHHSDMVETVIDAVLLLAGLAFTHGAWADMKPVSAASAAAAGNN